MDEELRKAALEYHRLPQPGKLAILPTKRMATQRDLALAYSPGVAAASEAIAADPEAARDLTARGNLVAVITNGTAVLGLGAIGPLAAKPVMEGKAVLFKKFAGIDVFDIEVDATDPDRFCDIVAALEPSFGAINLEDIKAPECFEIEEKLRARMRIPVFHDDQHGTAITVAAAVLNGLLLQGKKLSEVRLVTSGAGAAALACVDLLVSMGLPVENVILTDKDGVVRSDRPGMRPNMARYAKPIPATRLEEVLEGADIFLGLSAPRVLRPEWLAKLAPRPLVLALANPEPEIAPEQVRALRRDAIIATGRSDYPNQVNNVLCFPFIFRGALDVGATTINEAMKRAAAEAIAALARREASETVAAAYGGAAPRFGPDYIIPKPFDPRLILEIAPAVARAAMESGVARRPIADFAQYQRELERFVYRSGQVMRPVFERARTLPARPRIVYAEGEDERVLRAVQTVLDDGLAHPVVIGRRAVILEKARELGLRPDFAERIDLLDPEADEVRITPLIRPYQLKVGRRGVPPAAAARRVRTRPSVVGAMLLAEGLVDAALVGGTGDWWQHMKYVFPIIPRAEGISRVYALSVIILATGVLFLCDTHCNLDPTPEQIAEMVGLAAPLVARFGLTPKAALLSHSNFGASDSASARKMRTALGLIRERLPELEIDGEMHADAALSAAIRERMVPDSHLTDTANLLVFPNLDAAHIALNLLKAASEGLVIGPILMGLAKPVHVLVPSVTARGIVNMTALAATERFWQEKRLETGGEEERR
jgi:malate dehydrogenase (oxaloacetate-decarboxylating)(NADP+)